jgi:glutamine synthetase
MGVPVRYAHAEVGRVEPERAEDLLWEQHEIELAPAPLPAAADAIVLTRWVLRSLARRAGFRFSVDPILAEGHAGNGLHVHFTPTRDGEAVAVTDPDGALTEPARWLIGGLVRRGSALMAFGNRGAGSLLRLAQAKEAPSAITWAALDRSALVRIPAQARSGDGDERGAGTIEFRLPDGSARPHLLLAGVVASMIEAASADDLEVLLADTGSGAGSAGGARPVPRSLGEIADALEDARAGFETDDTIPSGLVERALRSLRAPGQDGP